MDKAKGKPSAQLGAASAQLAKPKSVTALIKALQELKGDDRVALLSTKASVEHLAARLREVSAARPQRRAT